MLPCKSFGLLFFFFSALGCTNGRTHSAPWKEGEEESWKKGLTQLRQEAWKINFQKLDRNGLQFQEVIVKNLFKKFVLHFERPYVDDESEYAKRQIFFEESLRRQAFFNSKEEDYDEKTVFGINKFSDWSEEEFRGLLKSYPLGKTGADTNHRQRILAIQQENSNENDGCTYKPEPLPKAVDWRDQRKVTKVKNQGNCGSCWAFVAAEQTETFWAESGKPLEDFSVQELISCAPSLGCSGGNTCEVLSWLAITLYNGSKYHLVSASEYPYKAKETQCIYDKTSMTGATLSGVCGCRSMVGHEDVMALVMAQKGPLGVNVNSVMWHDYVGGIIQRHCTSSTINHAVQLVGYDLSGPVPYWIARNSWGPEFGEDGYLRIKYGGNLCGLAGEPSFVFL